MTRKNQPHSASIIMKDPKGDLKNAVERTKQYKLFRVKKESSMKRIRFRGRNLQRCIGVLVFMLITACSSGGSDPVALPGPGGDANTQPPPLAERTVIYFGDDSLYAVRADGSDPICLDGPSVSGLRVIYGRWSPNGRRIAYSTLNGSNIYELYAVNVDSSGRTRLNGPLVNGGNVDSLLFRWSPDGRKILYRADQEIDEVVELYVVNADGSGLLKLNDPLVSGGNVVFCQWSPDGQKVVYRADQDIDNQFELYMVNPDGSGLFRFNANLVAGGDVLNASVSPDGTKMIYLADQDTDNARELFIAELDGSNLTKLNEPISAPGSVSFPREATWQPGGDLMLYRQDPTGSGVHELICVDMNGAGHTTMNDTLVSGGSINGFSWSPDGAMVAYWGDQDTDETYELYVIDRNGQTASRVKLNGNLPAGGDVDDYAWTPDGSKMIYTADEDSDNVRELYAVNADGSGRLKLNGALVAGGDVIDFDISPDGERVLYWADQDVDGRNELYVVNVDGSSLLKLSNPMSGGGGVNGDFDWYPDGESVYYIADCDGDGNDELYQAESEGGGSVQIGGAMDSGMHITIFYFSPSI